MLAAPNSTYGQVQPSEAVGTHDEAFGVLLAHPQLSPELRQRVKRLRREAMLLLFALSGVWKNFQRALALSFVETPPEFLREAQGSPRWITRVALARNPAAPRDVLEILARDGNRYVRAAARERLNSMTPREDSPHSL